MAEKVFERKKAHCNIGTIGHVDHGKTTLTAAITKVLSMSGAGSTKYVDYADIDKSKEERDRGITITASHVEYETDKRHYAHIDCPGHQNYIKNMITGVTQMDGAILVVSIVDGPQEQTKEHILLSREIGIKYLVVYLNKLDMVVEEELPEMVEMELRSLLEFYNFSNSDDIPMTRGSARLALEEERPSILGGESVLALMCTVDDYIPQPESKLDLPFLMGVEGVYSITGRGTVITGVVEQGIVKMGDVLDIVGMKVTNSSTVCMGVQMFRKNLEMGQAGDNLGILVRGLKRDEVLRGQVVCAPGLVKAYSKFKAKVYILSQEEGGRTTPINSGYKPQFFIRYANITGTISVDEGRLLLPGENGEILVNLLVPVALDENIRFTLREGKKTIGTGVVVEALDNDN